MMENVRVYRCLCITFFCIVIASFFYIFVVHSKYDDVKFVFDDESVEEWNDDWEINYDGTIEENVVLPVTVPVKQGNAVILRKNLPDRIKKNNCIMIIGKRQDIDVSVGGIQRASFSNADNRPFGKTSPSGIVLVPLYNTDSQSDVVIRVTSDSVYSGEIGNVYIGNEKSLLFKLLKNNIVWIFLDIIVFIIGVVCAVSYLTYGYSFKISKAMLYLAEFAIFSAIWGFTQSGLRQVFITDLTMFEAIGYCCYMLIPLYVLLYVNWVMEKKYEPITVSCMVVVMLNFVVENIIQAVFKVAFFDMRFFSQITYMLTIVVLLILCVFEIRREFGAMAKSLLIGMTGLLFGVSHSVTVLNMGAKGFQFGLQNRYTSGAFIFLVAGFVYTEMCVRKEQNLRKDAESANLAKSLFLATMSHEIKTPINAILGMNEIIQRDSKEDEVLECAAKIDEAGKSLLSLVNDVLDFSKIESGKMDIICVDYQLKSMLSDLISMVEMRIKDKQIKLVLDVDETIPAEYNGDVIRIKQVVTNLLTNAIKYTESGTITFSVKNKGIQDGEIDLYFSVKDTGVGIKEEDVSRFMDSFVRLDQVKNSNIEGTGLGLTITTQLLNLMGSKLEVDSVYGEGSDFYFTLKQKIVDTTPMGALKEKKERRAKKVRITFTAPDARILVVDDNKVNITVACGLLKPAKMQIDACDSGQKCLELCRDNDYDLIFMDHMMPEMDGVETFKRLKADKTLKSSDTNVVVLTANTVSGASEYYKGVGFDYYLKKPINVNELNEVVQKFIPQEMIRPLEGNTILQER